MNANAQVVVGSGATSQEQATSQASMAGAAMLTLTANGNPASNQTTFHVDLSWSATASVTVLSQKYAIDSVYGDTIKSVTVSNSSAGVSYESDGMGADVSLSGATNPTSLDIVVSYDPSGVSAQLGGSQGFVCHAVVAFGDSSLSLAAAGAGIDDGSAPTSPSSTLSPSASRLAMQPALAGGPPVKLTPQELANGIEKAGRMVEKAYGPQLRPAAKVIRTYRVVRPINVQVVRVVGGATVVETAVIAVGLYEIIDLGVYIHTGGKTTIGLTALSDQGGEALGRFIFHIDKGLCVSQSELSKIRALPVTPQDALKAATARMYLKGTHDECEELFELYKLAVEHGDIQATAAIHQEMQELICWGRLITWQNKEAIIDQVRYGKTHEIDTSVILAKLGYSVQFIHDTHKATSEGDAQVDSKLWDFKKPNGNGDVNNIINLVRAAAEKGQSPNIIIDCTGKGTTRQSAQQALDTIRDKPPYKDLVRQKKIKEVWIIVQDKQVIIKKRKF